MPLLRSRLRRICPPLCGSCCRILIIANGPDSRRVCGSVSTGGYWRYRGVAGWCGRCSWYQSVAVSGIDAAPIPGKSLSDLSSISAPPGRDRWQRDVKVGERGWNYQLLHLRSVLFFLCFVGCHPRRSARICSGVSMLRNTTGAHDKGHSRFRGRG